MSYEFTVYVRYASQIMYVVFKHRLKKFPKIECVVYERLYLTIVSNAITIN